MAAKISLCILTQLIFLISLQGGPILAQDGPSGEPAQEDQAISGQQPISDAAYQMPTSGRSLKDSVVMNSRNKVGFSLGLFGLYDRTILESEPVSDTDTREMLVLPTVFINLGRRKTQFHVDYSLEQRFFSDATNLGDLTFHTGNVSFVSMPNRHWTFIATDEVRSAPSDLLSLSGGFSPGLPIENPIGPGISGYSYERVFMNRGAAQLNYSPDRKTSIGFQGNSQVFRYETSGVNDTDAFNVGTNFERKLSRRYDMNIDFMYGRYETASGVRQDELKRLSGGLGYQISKKWRLFGNGGVEWVDTPGHSYIPSYFSAAIGRTTDLSIFSISYTKAAQYQLGTPQLNNTHTISLSFDQRLTSKSSLTLGAYYYRTEPYAEHVLQNTFISGAGFKYLLFRYIMASISGNYEYQDRAFNLDNSVPLKRLEIYAGIEIILPGVSRH